MLKLIPIFRDKSSVGVQTILGSVWRFEWFYVHLILILLWFLIQVKSSVWKQRKGVQTDIDILLFSVAHIHNEKLVLNFFQPRATEPIQIYAVGLFDWDPK